MTADLRIARLAGEAEEAANQWSPFRGSQVFTDYGRREICLETWVAPCSLLPEGGKTSAYFTLGTLDELLRDLLAARADLVKLGGGK